MVQKISLDLANFFSYFILNLLGIKPPDIVHCRLWFYIFTLEIGKLYNIMFNIQSI